MVDEPATASYYSEESADGYYDARAPMGVAPSYGMAPPQQQQGGGAYGSSAYGGQSGANAGYDPSLNPASASWPYGQAAPTQRGAAPAGQQGFGAYGQPAAYGAALPQQQQPRPAPVVTDLIEDWE